MEPKYMNEKRYSYLVGAWKPPASANYQAEDPATEFERQVQSLFVEGQKLIQAEKYYAAESAFRELMALILHTAHPQMPVDPNEAPGLTFPTDVVLVDTFTRKAAEILQKTPVVAYEFPATVMSQPSILPRTVVEKLKPALEEGLQVTSHHAAVSTHLAAALAAVEAGNYRLALEHYAVALRTTPADDGVLRASLSHDMAILYEKAGDRNSAVEWAEKSTTLFEAAKLPAAQVQALDAFTGILRRAGNEALATEQANKAVEIRKKNNFNPVAGDGLAPLSATTFMGSIRPLAAGLRAISKGSVDAPKLMAMSYVQPDAVTKTFTIRGARTTATIVLDKNAPANMKSFLETIRDTDDIGLLTDIPYTPVKMIAYLPHMYFFVIPMLIGDCLVGMGDRQDAVKQYCSVLPYPYINQKYELVKLWTRLGQVFLDMGDAAYRAARDNVDDFGGARAAYEIIVLGNKTLNPGSPLYADAQFKLIKDRVTSFLAAPDPVAHDDNPEIMWIVMGAFAKLQQIEAGLNYFGLPPDSPPPFSFEYMQNTARYFAEKASAIVQRYIQYTSQAENEQFRETQLQQQVDVAVESVELEKRGQAEAAAGIDVATASQTYADTQLTGAEAAKKEFDEAGPEMLEIEKAYAWNSNYGAEEHYTWRNTIRENVAQRTTLSNKLQSSRLQRAIDDAAAYSAVAQKQLDQAKKRKDIADQRVKIADLQNKQAIANRDFLTGREFNARLWRELAWEASRLKQCYLDRATEIALLMERAYNAETGRKLQVIASDYYSMTEAGSAFGTSEARREASDLMVADRLLADIDYFTYDYVTTVKTKKIPVKQVISLVSSNLMAFQQLKTKGRCFFPTKLEDFDRLNPGMYLCKLRNVELVFVGLTDAASLSGSLRNIGVSRFRLDDGKTETRLHPSDVMVLSHYDLRQDALAFRFNPNELRLFENNGIDTLWQLDLPLNANDFNYEDILDIEMVLYYDGFFSPSLETAVSATLPASGSAGRGFSMRMFFFDELYYLKNKGEGVLTFDQGDFPHNQTNLRRTAAMIKALGKPETIGGLTIRLASANHGGEMVLKTNATGEIRGWLQSLLGESMIDRWTLSITAADNPALAKNGVVDLSGLDDVQVFFEYSFDYR